MIPNYAKFVKLYLKIKFSANGVGRNQKVCFRSARDISVIYRKAVTLLCVSTHRSPAATSLGIAHIVCEIVARMNPLNRLMRSLGYARDDEAEKSPSLASLRTSFDRSDTIWYNQYENGGLYETDLYKPRVCDD